MVPFSSANTDASTNDFLLSLENLNSSVLYGVLPSISSENANPTPVASKINRLKFGNFFGITFIKYFAILSYLVPNGNGL